MPADPSSWQPIISAVSGLMGALIGGGATLLATKLASSETRQRMRADILAAKGEELVALLCRVGQWYEESERAASDKTKSLSPWPTDVFRMQALVEAYFPAMAKTANPVIQATIRYRETILNARTAMLEGKPNIWGEDFGQAYKELVDAAEALRSEVLTQMHRE